MALPGSGGGEGGYLRRFLFHSRAFFRIFSCFFEVGFGKAFSRTFSICRTLWGSHGKSFLVGFCKKVPLFLKRWYPRFCTPLQRFGLILQGLGPPAGAKKQEKTTSKLSFFRCGNKGTQTVFYYFKHVFGVILGCLLVDLLEFVC